MEKVSIIGLGYVGLPLVCLIASKGYEVVGVDLDKKKIEKIKNGFSPVEDVSSEEIKLVKDNVSSSFDDVRDSDIVIIAVPTPINESKLPDLSYVKGASEAVLPYLKKGQIVVLESTVNPGVCEEVVLPVLESTGMEGGKDFDLIHCPERIDPGNKKYNVSNIPRNIGGTSVVGTKRAADFYRSIVDAEINEMSSLKTAEATKIVENTFRDINIAYVNELAKSFDLLGLDIVEVINGAANKPFAFMPHFPGCGVGGHCIPVDPYYLIEKARDIGFNHIFLKIAREVNNSMPHYTIEKLLFSLNEIGLSVKGTKIGLLGLSYKANVGDLRESPALIIRKELEKLGANLIVYDPYIDNENVGLDYVLSNVKAVVVATNHDEFLNIQNWRSVKIVIDGRNCLNKVDLRKQGIIYKGIGRG